MVYSVGNPIPDEDNMRYLIIAVFLGCLLQGSAALAQPAGADEPGLSPAPPEATPAPPVAAPAPRNSARRMSRHRLHAYLMEHNPRYRSNRRMMLSGILVASVGGGLGALVAVIGLSGTMSYGLTYGNTSSDYDTFRYLVTAGLTTMVVSLAVGLPLTFVGRSRANTIRLKHLRLSAGVVPGGGMVGITWRF